MRVSSSEVYESLSGFNGAFSRVIDLGGVCTRNPTKSIKANQCKKSLIDWPIPA
jgi:hypothetical protein